MPFTLNPAQAYYWKHKTRRNIIIKARQKGISKIIDADQLMQCIRRPTNAVVISHEREATERLFDAVKFYVDNLDIKPEVSTDAKNMMKFPKRGSSYFIGTAGQRAFGRGDTVDRAHLSEAAFYQDLEKVLGGIAEAAEFGQIDIETTPNGRDQVHDMWVKAKAGKSVYTPIFIPWFIDQEFSTDNLTEQERTGLSKSVQEMIAIPDDEFELTEEEKKLMKHVREEWKLPMTLGMIKWRRFKIWDKGDLFFQEYPEEDVSCFLQSGRSVFTQIKVEPHLKIPLDNLDKWQVTDDIKEVYKKRTLYGAIDGAVGNQGGDRHAFTVMDVRKTKTVVIYEYVSDEPIDVFWSKILPVLRTFNIKLLIESNGIGFGHILKAKEHRIRHKEFHTGTNRPVMIAELEEAYRKEELIETYKEAEEEARDMQYTENNKAEHRAGKHDDRILSRAICFQGIKMPMPNVAFF